jgi:hypothetical protein
LKDNLNMHQIATKSVPHNCWICHVCA